MKCQNLFAGKKEKYFKMPSADNFTQSAKPCHIEMMEGDNERRYAIKR